MQEKIMNTDVSRIQKLRDDLFFLFLHDEVDTGDFYEDWHDHCPKLVNWVTHNYDEFRKSDWTAMFTKFRDELDEMMKKDDKERHLKEIHDASLQYD